VFSDGIVLALAHHVGCGDGIPNMLGQVMAFMSVKGSRVNNGTAALGKLAKTGKSRHKGRKPASCVVDNRLHHDNLHYMVYRLKVSISGKRKKQGRQVRWHRCSEELTYNSNLTLYQL